MQKIEKRQISIRHAADNEREMVADVVQRAYVQFKETYDANYWIEYEASTRAAILQQENVLRLIAHIDDRAAGVVLLCPPYERMLGTKLVKNPYPEFRLLAVDPDFRDMGVGAVLIDECERIAKSQGFDQLSLHTTELMQTAKNMYKRRAYSRFTDIDFSPAPNFTVMGYKKELL